MIQDALKNKPFVVVSDNGVVASNKIEGQDLTDKFKLINQKITSGNHIVIFDGNKQ